MNRRRIQQLLHHSQPQLEAVRTRLTQPTPGPNVMTLTPGLAALQDGVDEGASTRPNSGSRYSKAEAAAANPPVNSSGDDDGNQVDDDDDDADDDDRGGDETAGFDVGFVGSFVSTLVADRVARFVAEAAADGAAGQDATDPRFEPGTVRQFGFLFDDGTDPGAEAEGGSNVNITGAGAAAASAIASAIVAGADNDGRVDSVHDTTTVGDVLAAGAACFSSDVGSDCDAAPGCDAGPAAGAGPAGHVGVGSDASVRRQDEQGMRADFKPH